jgi:phosphopantothenoylcysteine decarboxylase/phosphopantothenate--cysteine ligase
MLKGAKIVLGVTGGIAAYKIPFLIRELTATGAEVRVVMTEAAEEFVAPLTLATLSGHPVVRSSFPNPEAAAPSGTWHIELGRWCQAMLIAPATANVLARLAHGEAADSVTTLALAMRAPVIVSPAMDADMWEHPATQKNVAALEQFGYRVLPPEEGELASGLTGKGRLPDFSVLLGSLEEAVTGPRRDLAGKKILITAGPTQEPIDPVRYISNRSSGKMGFALAQAAAERGAEVTLIAGKVALATPRGVAERVDVLTAADMLRAVMEHRKGQNAVIMAAAVADFTPSKVSPRKLKKEELSRDGESLTLQLRRTPDILAALAAARERALVVGFALETHNDLAEARRKLKQKKVGLLILNNALQKGAGFDGDTNIVSILSQSGKVERLKKMSKLSVAHEILNRVARKLRA